MREISVLKIEEEVCRLCIDANLKLPSSLECCIEECGKAETNETAKGIFKDMLENLEIAQTEELPICQDTGMAVIFIEIGQNVYLTGGSLEEAINKGVAEGYTNGLLRMSIVKDPLRRVNTQNNTPAIIHTKIVDGDKVKIDVCPKGFGSENMSAVKMFTPSATVDEIVNFITETVKTAGGNPCPPTIIGVGIGGNFEYSAFLAKKALCRDIAERNSDPFYADLENKILTELNKLNIGCQGFGGDITALGVNIEQYPTHIAGLPVAVNVGCHVTRHASVVI
ncbi:MAG: fumarate hydratase [Oscillospiraceae bacterium]|jgi:fumarate hydratase subunit alpha|nr:fumarate hydratase [Oscillospiraceae bacterium]